MLEFSNVVHEVLCTDELLHANGAGEGGGRQ